MSLTKSLITQDTLSRHRATWYVYTGEIVDGKRQRIRRQATMRGFWPGYDVVCSCGWESRTGGGLKGYVADVLFDHRFSEQCAAEREATQ